MAKRIGARNRKLVAEAKRYLVGGVDSPVRSFGYVGGDPLLIEKGKGAKVYDYDGNSYIDYVLSWGSLILGHAHPAVIRALKDAIGSGLGFGATNSVEIELARTICDTIPFIDKIRFVNSGTEAVMGAVRLARGFTGRDKILKFENSYHGHADYLLIKGGSGLATLRIPQSAGVPGDFVKYTISAPSGNIKALRSIFKRYGNKIAAVLVEPVGGNFGVVPPGPDFLTELRLVTKENKTLLIFDEIITGFRFGFGSIAQKIGITPDLICLGKIIGGGLPIGAYGGSGKIMERLAPLGDVYQASTFSGNPVVMRSGLETLKLLKRAGDSYRRIDTLTQYLGIGLECEAKKRGVDLKVTRYGSMFSLKFKEKRVFERFFRLMLDNGVSLAPSEFEANFLSFEHMKEEIDNTIIAARRALKKIGE